MEAFDYHSPWPAWTWPVSWFDWSDWTPIEFVLLVVIPAWVIAGWWNYAPDIERLRQARRRRLATEAAAAEAAAGQAPVEQTIATEAESPDRS